MDFRAAGEKTLVLVRFDFLSLDVLLWSMSLQRRRAVHNEFKKEVACSNILKAQIAHKFSSVSSTTPLGQFTIKYEVAFIKRPNPLAAVDRPRKRDQNVGGGNFAICKDKLINSDRFEPECLRHSICDTSMSRQASLTASSSSSVST